LVLVYFLTGVHTDIEDIENLLDKTDKTDINELPRSRAAKYQNEFYLFNPDAEHRGILLIKVYTNLLEGSYSHLEAFERHLQMAL